MGVDLQFVPMTVAPDAGADVASQTRAVLDRVSSRLHASGSSLPAVVATTVYLRRAADFAAMNDAYRAAWSGSLPTRTTLIADPATPGALIGISAVATPPHVFPEPLHPAGWRPAANPYSYVIRAGDTVFCSGLLARSGVDGSVIGDDITTQTRAVLENAKALLASAGLTLRDVVSARVFLPDLGEFGAMNDVYGQYFPDAPPARATIGADLTAPPYKVEMTFVARGLPRDVIADEKIAFRNLSPAIRSGNALFVSGALGVTAGQEEDAAAQARETLRRVDTVLTRSGFARDHVRDLLVYITDPADAVRVTEECHAWAVEAAVSVAGIRLAVPGGKVEIMTIAIKG